MVRSHEKACSLCEKVVPVLYHVQFDASGEWWFVCRDCWEHVSRNKRLYTYSGTWKAQKR
ncbi:hypothetical protein GS601_13815 [Myxacorys almedinensis A]|uniref:Uncharacterized protein n=1 Tax=Myxacorys almedinensis A TaxID=2690445 RepID=A0A8J7Z319_9CYAN|nr:hypothetical protein [Myxacorys almedinensis A]